MSTITRQTAGGIMKDDYQDPGRKKKGLGGIGERIRNAMVGRGRRRADTEAEKNERSRGRSRAIGRLLPPSLRPGEKVKKGLDEILGRGRG